MIIKRLLHIYSLERKRAVLFTLMVASGVIYVVWSAFPPASAPQYVSAAKVTRADIDNNVLATGVVQAIQQVDVGTRVTGQLKSLKVKLGDHVHAGDLLAEIDPILQENELRSARANLSNLEAQKSSAVARLRRSKLEFDRQRGMIKGAVTSRRELESAETQMLADEASLAALEAQIAQAKSQIDIATANLSYTRITAPIEGDVVAVLTQEGQTVVAAQVVPVILKLARLDAITVKTQVSEADVVNVKVGQAASFTIMGDPEKRYAGRLRAIEPAPQSYSDPVNVQGVSQSSSATSATTAVFYNALFDVPNPERILRIGMTAQVSITLGVLKDVLSIPSAALREQAVDGRYAVRVLDSRGHLELRQVRVGVNVHAKVEILDGLKEGESVVTEQVASSAPTAAQEARQ